MKSKRISIIALAFIMLFSAVFGVSNLFLAKAEYIAYYIGEEMAYEMYGIAV